jgi:hypothetical protein
VEKDEEVLKVQSVERTMGPLLNKLNKSDGKIGSVHGQKIWKIWRCQAQGANTQNTPQALRPSAAGKG